MAALADVCEIVMGQAPKGDTYNTDDIGIPLIAGAGDFGDLHPRVSRYTTAERVRMCQPGDIVLSIRASIGTKVLADGEYCLGRGVAGLRARRALDDRYLWHWMTVAAPALMAKGRGATFLQVNKTDISELEIPVPSIEEQRRIAAVLDAADALRAKRREVLAKLDTLTQAIFIHMFGDPATNSMGWPVAQLQDICVSKGEYGAGVASVAFDGSKPRYLRITDIKDDGTLTDDPVSPAGSVEDWGGKRLSPGDLLFARSGATVGKAFLMRTHEPMIFAGYLIRFVPDPQLVSPDYLFAFTRTQAYWKWVENAATTVAQPNLNAKKYGLLEVPLPPSELQAEFVARLDSVAAMRACASGAEERLAALAASLQQRAFRGEL